MKNDSSGTIRRSRIDDISAVGEELSEEHLRLVSGGAIRTRRNTYSPTCLGGGIDGCGRSTRDHTDTYSDTW
jgi:hypothetical protein